MDNVLPMNEDVQKYKYLLDSFKGSEIESEQVFAALKFVAQNELGPSMDKDDLLMEIGWEEERLRGIRDD